jgi:hypothetical protein
MSRQSGITDWGPQDVVVREKRSITAGEQARIIGPGSAGAGCIRYPEAAATESIWEWV